MSRLCYRGNFPRPARATIGIHKSNCTPKINGPYPHTLTWPRRSVEAHEHGPAGCAFVAAASPFRRRL